MLLFIFQDYDSYITISFHNLNIKNKIVVFYLFLYFIYLTSSLNIGVSQSFKHYHINTIDKAIQLNDEKFDKLEFLAAFQLFYNQTFKSTTIRHTFKSTKLVLFNPDMILDKICEKQAQITLTSLETPSLPPFSLH